MHKLHLPRLGQTMEHGTLVAWLKREGESFTVGEPLYEVESEKANLEIEAKLPGTLTRIVAREGQVLPIRVAASNRRRSRRIPLGSRDRVRAG